MHPRAASAAAIVVILAVAPGVAAHGDARGHHGDIALASGETFIVTSDIHWHRLVGEVRAHDSDDVLQVAVIGPDGHFRTVLHPDDHLVLNELIRCCLEVTWATHHIWITNVGETHLNATVDLVFLHDDLAVVADNAEGDGLPTTFLLVAALSGVPAFFARRLGVRDDAYARRWWRIGWSCLGAAWLLAGVATLVGLARHGGPWLPAMRAAFAPFPIYSTFVNGFLPFALLLMALWTLALVGWAKRSRHGAREDHPKAAALPLAAAAGAVVFIVLFGRAYDNWGLAWVLGGVPALILAVTSLWPRRPHAPSGPA